MSSGPAPAPRPPRFHDERVQALARAIVPANPFAAERWRAAGMTAADDLRSWRDFARLPFTHKVDLVEDQAAHPPFGSNLTDPLERYVRVALVPPRP